MLTIAIAAETDAADLAALYAAVAADLTARLGPGNWSGSNDESTIRRLIRTDTVLVAHQGPSMAGGLRLSKETPLAAAVAYFGPARQPIYLLDLAVAPALQGRGVGRQLMAFAEAWALEAGREAARLDAYDHAVGAPGFYLRCGYVERGHAVYQGTPLIYFDKALVRQSV